MVDDGSTDGSREIAENIAAGDCRVRVVSFERRVGLTAALNAGIAAARGDLIARMDADDVSLPRRLEVQVDFLERHGLDACGTWAARIGERRGFVLQPETPEAVDCELVFGSPLLHPTALIRRSALPDPPYDPAADYQVHDLWQRMAAAGRRLGNVPQVLLEYRHHPGQTSRRHARTRMESRVQVGLRHLRHRYPGAAPEDRETVEKLIRRQAMADLAALRRAGSWLERLSVPPDAVLRRRMAGRWLQTCRASAGLGPRVWAAYRGSSLRLRSASRWGQLALLARCCGLRDSWAVYLESWAGRVRRLGSAER